MWPNCKLRCGANPLMDGSVPEIVVDNDDKEHVRTDGSWNVQKGGYGSSYFTTTLDGQATKTITFTPAIKRAGNYDVYVYLPKVNNMAREIPLQVFDGVKAHAASIEPAAIKVAGQTSGEWVKIGSYKLPAGAQSHLKMEARGTDGVVIADAVLFIPR